MNTPFKFVAVFISSLIFFAGMSQTPEGIVSVTPEESDSVLTNPGIGFNTFQRFNGDTLFPGMGWREGFPIVYQQYKGTLKNKEHPQTTIAYWRVYWRYLEPEKNKYRWDLVEQALDSARRRGQRLLLRIAPYGTVTNDQDVPDWYRKLVGPSTAFKYGNPVNKWMVDAEDPRYAEYFGGFIKELGKRYNGHPDLEGVDLSIVGAWGEGAGSELLTRNVMEALIDAYAETFTTTPLFVMIMDKKTNQYALSKGIHMGWRADCLGDLGFWKTEQNGWTHMYDFYPQSIIEYGLADVWKKAPVSFEICGTFRNWRDVQKYGAKEVQYIFNEALKWHISSFNAKSSPVPEEWAPMVDDWLKKMGYRFVLKRFKYPAIVGASRQLGFESYWENKGVAPCYTDYPLAIRLKNNRYKTVLTTEADIRNWLPGDNTYNEALYLPSDIPEGEYDLEIALIDKYNRLNGVYAPAVKLAIKGRNAEGWYSIGKIRVKK